ncbi:unnamed protein product [Tetraodon nigroviridis]|uniref:(spotted green pufferfish) hypothetical protein n=1 Tax=Tetraodon nigroviridis TaxID=99883 RepID=Q4RJ19_TETNG|nr:unnamed protein product [Tetraodon nigroviridis]
MTEFQKCLLSSSASCKGRCGTDYYRGYMCQCDYTCLSYDECCEDYESQCTTKNSCKGRCGEGFRRGRRCSCDPDCQKFKQCCSDFQTYCDAADDQLMPLVSPAVDPDDLSDDMDSVRFAANGAGDPESTPNPGSISGDGLSADLVDRSTDSTQDSNSAEFSRETSTVVPPAHSQDEDGYLATLSPTGGRAAADPTVGVTELETAEADAHGTTPASSDGPPRTQTAPSSAVASASTVGSTAALEDSEWTGSSASSTLQPSAAASKDVATGPLLQELLTTLLPAALGVTGDDTTAGATTNDPSAVTQKPGKTTSKAQDNPSPTASVTQGAHAEQMSSYQAGRKAFRLLCFSFAAKHGGLTHPSNCSRSVMKCWSFSPRAFAAGK